jgi:dehydrogenase/reductase SDR family protein 12
MIADLLRRSADAALEATTLGSFTRLGPAARRRIWDWEPIDTVALAGKVVVVPGATSGLGAEIAVEVAHAGASVVAVGRNPERGAATVDRIRRRGGTARFATADLAELDDVEALAAQLRDDHDEIHAVVHNAGALLPERRVSSTGLEVTWASMVVGPHLLNHRLVDRLGRAVWMASGGLYLQALDLDDWGWEQRPWNGTRAYAQAKRAQIDLVAQADRPPNGPLQVALHPGWADTPGVEASLPGFRRVMGPLLRTPAEGAETAVWLCAAAGEDLEPGRFYLDRRPRGTVRWPGTGTSPVDRTRLRALVDDQAGIAP